MKTLLANARIIDTELGLDEIGSILLDRTGIAGLGQSLSADDADTVFDCSGLTITPGWIDMHSHLRVPGQEHKETIATGTASAAAGGFTEVACMPNTVPALDSVETFALLAEICSREAVVPVHPIGAITIGREGEQTVDFDALADAGAVGFSDDGQSTANAALMVEALKASKRLGVPIMVHCEDPTLIGGAIHEGVVSARLGLKGIPAAAEESFIARDCLLAAETGGWLHALHVSTGKGLDIINLARSWGAHVTAEVMPHHLIMSEEWVAGSRILHNTTESGADAGAVHPDTKVNPPLRSIDDTRRLLDGLIRGEFDIIATDHAPHANSEKRETSMEKALMGMLGFEFAVPAMLALVRAGHLSLADVVYRFATVPARLWGLAPRTLAVGSAANLTILDESRTWQVSDECIVSKSRNTPLMGMTLTGRAVMTIVNGKVVHDLHSA